MIQNEPIIVEQTYNVSVDRVWKAITDSSQMKQWFFENINSFKAEVGFETQFNVQANDKNYLHLWKISEVQTGKKIVYNWKYDGYEGNSYVTWELSPENIFTKLKLTHKGQETFPQDNPDFKRENCIGGWQFFICQRLKEFLEAGN
ncbi:MAG: SRPBCC domain-containing protein [Bacteroidota bacterium]